MKRGARQLVEGKKSMETSASPRRDKSEIEKEKDLANVPNTVPVATETKGTAATSTTTTAQEGEVKAVEIFTPE